MTLDDYRYGPKGFMSNAIMRNSSLFFIYISGGAVLLGLLLAHASFSESARQPVLEEKAMLVKTLKLTDLCLFTEARYTRNLSQADLNTAFQDHPLSLEHFPSGSFTQPPESIRTFP
jgi:uncharacterized protein YjbI with pentapeptide repeats